MWPRGRDEARWPERIRELTPYRITRAVIEATGKPATPSSCTACRVPQRRDRFCPTSPSASASIAWRSMTRCSIPGLDRLRPSRNPHAHHQGTSSPPLPGELDVVVVALGGNALLRRGGRFSAETQRSMSAAPPRRSPTDNCGHGFSSPTATGPKSDCSPSSRSSKAGRSEPLDILGRKPKG